MFTLHIAVPSRYTDFVGARELVGREVLARVKVVLFLDFTVKAVPVKVSRHRGIKKDWVRRVDCRIILRGAT